MLTQVADGVFVHQSEVLQNNAVAVEGDSGVLLVDPGLTSAEMSCLASDLRGRNLSVAAGFATHPDWDHVLWHSVLGSVPRWATAGCASSLGSLLSAPDWRDRVAEGLPPEIASSTPLSLFGQVTALPAGATEVPWDGPRVRVIEHPAHAQGHAALLVEEPGVLIAGDMLSDLFVPMLNDWTDDNDPIAEYLVGLDRLSEVAGDVDVVVPGHGSVGRDVSSRLELDRAYVFGMRDGVSVSDPRIDSPPAGGEWVTDIHEGQVAQVRARSSSA